MKITIYLPKSAEIPKIFVAYLPLPCRWKGCT